MKNTIYDVIHFTSIIVRYILFLEKLYEKPVVGNKWKFKTVDKRKIQVFVEAYGTE